MRHHWEISWSTIRPLTDSQVEEAVRAFARLGCSTTALAVETIDARYVAVRHRTNEEFLLEFGFAEDAPGPAALRPTCGRGLVENGHIAWNWCCTAKKQPETGLVILKFKQVQQILGDALFVWDDAGKSHWSWGSCPIEQTGTDPLALIDAHLGKARAAS
jgi:hypothetical protein